MLWFESVVIVILIFYMDLDFMIEFVNMFVKCGFKLIILNLVFFELVGS